MDKQLVWLDSPREIERHLSRNIPEYDLTEPGLRFILCDGDNEVFYEAQCGELDQPDEDGLVHPPEETVAAFIRDVLGEHFPPEIGLLLALTRPRGLAVTDDDRACFRAARSACAHEHVRLMGVHVVTPRGQRELTVDDVL
jgi:hypothetical protein